ncbi:MAG: Holliday junction branch migration DNA helicase RuvB, partial [Candidatus Omnitrophota bacterium]
MNEERQRLILAQETDDEQIVNISLRPAKLDEFIGQREIVDNLKVALTAAQKRKEQLEHILLSGSPG